VNRGREEDIVQQLNYFLIHEANNLKRQLSILQRQRWMERYYRINLVSPGKLIFDLACFLKTLAIGPRRRPQGRSE
jgi:hypothetical protein